MKYYTTQCTLILSYHKLSGFHVHAFPVRHSSCSRCLLLTIYGRFYKDYVSIYMYYCWCPSSSQHAHYHTRNVALWKSILPFENVFFISPIPPSTTLYANTVYCSMSCIDCWACCFSGCHRKDFEELFDVIITNALKPGFFSLVPQQRPFRTLGESWRPPTIAHNILSAISLIL